MKLNTFETDEREDAIVVGLVTRATTRAQVNEYLDELILLTDTASADVKHKFTQERDRIDAATFIGSGKAKEIGEMVVNEKIDRVIFDGLPFTGADSKSREKSFPLSIDRSALDPGYFRFPRKIQRGDDTGRACTIAIFPSPIDTAWTHFSNNTAARYESSPAKRR